MRSEIFSIKNCKKIAIMGGTFDPIHYGHLVAAEAVRQEMGIERVVFIPTGRPPHKKDSRVMHNEHRYLMTVLATVTNPYFDVSRIEIDRPGMTYTIDTIKDIKRYCDDDCQLYFITGADAINQILTWKNAQELLGLCDFVAVTRPEYNRDKLMHNLNELESQFKSKLHFLEIPALAISSTDIRNRVLSHKTIKYLVPEAVEEYIMKNELYIGEATQDTLVDTINKRLHYLLNPKRFAHTQGVADEAVKLAGLYGVDTHSAYIAGLLHDCAKDYTSDEKLQMCEEYGIELDEILVNQVDLTHSFLGAKVAEEEFGIKDTDILNSIKYHTTGRANMSKLEKIIYLADFFEPNRKYFDGIVEIKKLAYEDLDKAMAFSLRNTIDYNEKKKRLIHPLSIEALKYYEK